MNRSPLYVLSLRNLVPYPAQGCVMELEDVFSATMAAPIVAPANDADIADFMRRAGPERADLFLASITLNDSIQVLKRLNGWRETFGKVFVYIFDAFLPDAARQRSPLRKRFSRLTKITSGIDHIFVPIRQEVEAFASYCDAPVSYLPMAVDVEKFGSGGGNRAIDVNAYGRQNFDHVNALADIFNKKDSGRSLYYTNHMSIAKVTDLARHRAFFWKMLSMSRIALAYDAHRIDPDGRNFPYPFIGQRWFESLAAGCVVVGYRPDCPEAAELLPWKDATIECPEGPAAFVGFIENLLLDTERLAETRLRNYAHMLSMHDWSYRVEAMSRIVGVATTQTLTSRVSRLRELANDADASYGHKLVAQAKGA